MNTLIFNKHNTIFIWYCIYSKNDIFVLVNKQTGHIKQITKMKWIRVETKSIFNSII